MRSEIVFSDRQLRRITTWCQLGLDLFDRTPEYGSHPRIGHLDDRFRLKDSLYRPTSVPLDASLARGIKSSPVIGS